jgi:transposase
MVPSQSQNAGGYLVNVLAATCSCPDHELRRVKCKHQWAVEFSQVVETVADGSQVVTETVKVTRKTYAQDWPRYNAAQCAEKATVEALLRSLCEGIVTPPQTMGRPRHSLADAVYAMTMKVYTTVSGRRATTDIDACAEKGHMAKAPRYNTTFDYFAKPELTPLLTALIGESAAPLACVESQFAVDSTGFGTVTYRRWYDHKYGREMKEHGWVKAHAMVGTTTNVITAIGVTDYNVNDCPELPALVASTGRRFAMAEVSADKAYLSHANLAAVEAAGAIPYVPFKSNSKGAGPAAWRRMWGLFMYKQAEFLAHYHARSNVESTFSAVKRKFGGSVRSKNATAQTNEVLCKALCFNLSMLVHAMHELGVQPSFPGVAGLTAVAS